MNARDKERAERRKKVVALGRAEVAVTEICKRVSTPRNTVVKWLEDAGIEPTMLRQRGPAGARSLSAGKALSIEEGVRRRIAAMEEPPDEAA